MRIFRQIWHFSKVLVVWGTGVEVLAVFGAKMVFFPRLIFIISIISHNFSKIFFFNLKNLTFIFITPIIIHNFSYNLIISNHFLSLKNIFFQSQNSTPKHIFKKNLNFIQHPNTFSLPRNSQTDSEYYSYSIPKRTISFSYIFLIVLIKKMCFSHI